jgi:hypothetical protein
MPQGSARYLAAQTLARADQASSLNAPPKALGIVLLRAEGVPIHPRGTKKAMYKRVTAPPQPFRTALGHIRRTEEPKLTSVGPKIDCCCCISTPNCIRQ